MRNSSPMINKVLAPYSIVMAALVLSTSCGPVAGSEQNTESEPETGMGDTETSSDTTVGSNATTSAPSSSSSTSTRGSQPSETDSTTGGGSELTPAEQAATIACEARETIAAFEIPAPNQHIGFSFSEYPARFYTDFSQAEGSVFEGDMWCHWLTNECTDCECPLVDCYSWMDPDEEIRIHMVTRGIDKVEFYGTDESPAGTPGAPLTPSVSYDVGAECPELPTVWTPDPTMITPGTSNRIVCMHHSEDVAEIMFVRTP